MAETVVLKVLGQLRPANTTAASLYSPGANEEVTINNLVAANLGTSSVKIRLFLDDNGTTYDETTAIGWDIEIPPGRIYKHPGVISMNDATGNLAVRTDTANDVNFTATGSVIS